MTSTLIRRPVLPAELLASQAAQDAALASFAAAGDGAGRVGFDPDNAYAVNTTGARLREVLTTSGFASLQAAVTAAAGKTLRVIGVHAITAAIAVPSNTTIVLEPGSSIETATPDIPILDCTGRSRVHIYGPGKLKSTNPGAAGSIGHIFFNGSIDCLAIGVEIEGFQWHGVLMQNATRCHALYCYAHDRLGTVQDSAGFGVMRDSIGCSVEKCAIKNPGWHGVLVQDPGSGTTPVGTRVCHNDIDGATAYGVIAYEITETNTETLIEGNRIRNISGSSLSGAAGAGIYIAASGGVIVRGNHIRNVCTASSNNLLTPAGIGVNGIANALVAPVIDGNVIIDVGMTAGGASNPNALTLAGIYIASSPNGAVLANNSIRQGPGLTPAQFIGVYGNGSSNLTIGPHRVTIANSLVNSEGALIFANNVNVSKISFCGFDVDGAAYAGIECTQVGGFTVSQVTISGGVLGGGAATMVPLRINKTIGCNITGVEAGATTVPALMVSDSTHVRIAGGSLTSSGTHSIATSGVCTAGYLDKSTHFGGPASKLNNAGTGFLTEFHASAVPSAGTHAVGDRAEQSVPIPGNPKGWRCTVAGAPGTWASEGNL